MEIPTFDATRPSSKPLLRFNGDGPLGVVGGMGPLAALRFLEHVLSKTPVASESDHIRVLLDNDPGIPSRLAAYRKTGLSPTAQIMKSMELLASMGARAIAVPCNAVHYFLDQIPRDSSLPWIHMVKAVSERISARSNKPLVLGAQITVSERLYSKYLPDARYLSEEQDAEVFRLIEELKLPRGGARPELCGKIAEFVGQSDCDCVLLACTELTVLAEHCEIRGRRVIDSSVEYACAVVERMRSARI